MKAFFPILLSLTMLCPAHGQETDDDAGLADEVQKAIREFNSKRNAGKEPENEVVVELPPPESQAEPADEEPTAEAEPQPTLVTGKPPAGESVETAAEVSETEPVAAPETLPAESEGLGIRVEPIRDGKGETGLGQIKLKASFPAKALSSTPDGWILEKSEQAPAFLEEVTLRPGKTVSLSISPHVLTPASDGENTFGVIEPGFDVSEGYRQSNTVSAILGNSIVQLDRDALLLGNAISDLHQLLASLPKPEPEAPAEP